MKSNIKTLFAGAALLLGTGFTSCTGDLDVTPIDPNLNTADKITAEQSFNKCYGVIGLAGNGGANGDSDVDGIDGGTSGYIRQLWNSNELTTDESICGWGDDGIATFCFNTYDAAHPMLEGFYYRLYTSIGYCNQYITDFGSYNETMTAEVRFLRALSYFYLMDAFGNVTFSTQVQTTLPPQYSRSQMFEFVESELLEIESLLSDAKPKKSTDEGYGRVDKAADWLLLARLYLNAEVYTGTAQWAKAAEYAKKVMDSSYQLNTTGSGVWSAYQMLFMGDNGETSAAYEAIFPILQDGLTTTSWGTTLFLIAGSTDANVHANPLDESATTGTTEAWGGNRARSSLLAKFFPNNDAPNVRCYVMTEEAGDDRALFDGVDRTLTNDEQGTFTNGYAVPKFTNFKTDGSAGHSSQFPDGDFFLMRKAEAYLTYAEAMARQNGGTTSGDATEAVNTIRNRAHASLKATYTLSDLCDEWSREFYYEGRRRMDLVRFGYYGGNTSYVWPWKGGSFAGRQFDEYRNIFAIPTKDLTSNSNLVQNNGYK